MKRFPIERASLKYAVQRDGPSRLPPTERRTLSVFTARTFALELARIIHNKPGQVVRISGNARQGYFVHVNLTRDDLSHGGNYLSALLHDAYEEAIHAHEDRLQAMREKIGLRLHSRIVFYQPRGIDRNQFDASAAIGIKFHPNDSPEPPEFEFTRLRKRQPRRR